ncbi:MAG: hypothetical protein J5594_01875, partial [Elusimicrobiaceae bacterium]|nr:hypothetical protein [Elusimicrobiaceae bacterium]
KANNIFNKPYSQMNRFERGVMDMYTSLELGGLGDLKAAVKDSKSLFTTKEGLGATTASGLTVGVGEAPAAEARVMSKAPTEIVANVSKGGLFNNNPVTLFDRSGVNTQIGSSGRAVRRMPNSFKISGNYGVYNIGTLAGAEVPNFRFKQTFLTSPEYNNITVDLNLGENSSGKKISDGLVTLRNAFIAPENENPLVTKQMAPYRRAAAIGGLLVGGAFAAIFGVPEAIGTTLASLPLIATQQKSLTKEAQDFIELRKRFTLELFRDFDLTPEEAENMERILGKKFFDLWQTFYNQNLQQMAIETPELIEELAKYSHENTLPSLNDMYESTNPLYVFTMHDLKNNFIKSINDGKTIEEAITELGEAMFDYHKKIYQINRFMKWRGGKVIDWSMIENPAVYNYDLENSENFGLAEEIGFGKLNTEQSEVAYVIINQAGYTEYLDEFLHSYDHPKTYKEVTLSWHRVMNPFEVKILYPNFIVKDGVSNNTLAFNAMQGDLEVIKPIFAKYQQNGSLSEEDIKILHTNIADMIYILTNAVPFFRGTATSGLIIADALYEMAGIEMPKVKIGRSLDLSAFGTTPEKYQQDWQNLFDREFPNPRPI